MPESEQSFARTHHDNAVSMADMSTAVARARLAVVSSQLTSNLASSRGYVFLCNGATQRECEDRQLFGLPNNNFRDMERNIMPFEGDEATTTHRKTQCFDPVFLLQMQAPTLIFLWNFSSRSILGVWVADGPPAKDMVPEAWQGRYPAQVAVLQAERLESRRLQGPQQSGYRSATEVTEILQALGITREDIARNLAHHFITAAPTGPASRDSTFFGGVEAIETLQSGLGASQFNPVFTPLNAGEGHVSADNASPQGKRLF